ncbi:MAG: CarD family transcriptional regulator [Ruminococcaceae bacterium]|nr:CarD family transcriptional regulator [Oscillospiraceae bacterium]MBQ7398260.1 CarD family transcriptional regulator [Clostridia bacterium]
MRMFSVGSYVVYGSQGVCRISEIRREDFSGTAKDYYILTPSDDPKMVIYVPTDAATLTSQMRQLLSLDELTALIHDGAAAEPMEWINDPRSRNEQFRQILQSGDRLRLFCLLRAIHERREQQIALGKKLYAADEAICQRAEKLLHGEIAAVLNIKPDEVQSYIQSQLLAEG